MLRLKRDDFEDPHELARLAATAHLSVEEFRDRFAYLTAHQQPVTVAVTDGSPQTSRS